MAASGRRPNSGETSLDPAAFESILQIDVPKGRAGKHKAIVTRILADIDNLKPGMALKIPLNDLADSKENIRSALNRATRLQGVEVATSSDQDHLYVWKSEHKR
jgi:hypothetical protein